MPVYIYESKFEETNGNDLEILIEAPAGYVLFPAQAKIIYPNHRYNSINHKGRCRYQIDLLLEYAERKKGIPFMMYNTCTNNKMLKQVAATSIYNIESFGCSIAPAKVVKNKFCKLIGFSQKWTIPSFADIHCEMAYPLSIFPCAFSHLLKDNFIGTSQLYFDQTDEINFYSLDEILNDSIWSNIISSPGIGKIEFSRSINIRTDHDQMFSFNPKVRVAFSKKFIEENTIVWHFS